MRFLFFFVLFFLISCLEPESNSRFHGSRTKQKGAKERQRPNQETEETAQAETDLSPQEATAPSPVQPAPQAESLIFPFVFKGEHVKVHLQPKEEQKKMLVSVEPGEIPVSLVAGFSGKLSLTENEESHILSVSPKNKDRVFFFELSKETTKLLVADGASVAQKAPIAESSKPVLFYIKKENQLTRLCFSVDQISTSVTIVQDYENHPDCTK